MLVTIRCAMLALGLLGALRPGSAWAHAAFMSAQPEPGQRLETTPGVVTLRFTEPINGRLSRATVIEPSGQRSEGQASGEQEIQVPLSTNAPGIYEVDWTTVSIVDGHTLHGAFRFGVRVSPGEGAEGATSLAPQWPDLLIAVLRTVEYAALLTAVGMLLLQRIAGREPPLAWVRARPALPLAAALVSGLAVVAGEALAAAATPSADALVDYLGAGVPGAARLLRVVAEAVALALSVFGARLVLAPLGLAILGLAAAGHAAAVRPAWWGIGADLVHLVAAGLWAGGILALATVRPPGGWRGSEGWKLLQRFSPIALAAFAVTVGAGAVRSFQELGQPGDLLTSSYGLVLDVKVLGVLAMLPLSLLAWRYRSVAPRLEATLAIAVLAAAALLAAHPLPLARAGEAEEAAGGRSPSASALPENGDLTLGGSAGQSLVALTLRPGEPGRNDILVYLLPLEGEAAASGIPAQLSTGGRSLGLQECGPTCRSTQVDLQGGETLEVNVPSPKGGTAVFQLPELPAPDASDLLQQMQDRMHRIQRLRVEEVLGPADPPIQAAFTFQAPDRMRSEVGPGSETVWAGETRYTRDSPAGAWKVERVGTSLKVPAFVWDAPGNPEFVAPRLVGRAAVDGVDTKVVSFFMQAGQIPIWFRVFVDADGVARRAEMRAQGHFMDDHYHDFDGPFTVEPPTG